MEGYFMELVLNDAKRWVDEAIAFYRMCGKAIALSEFSNARGRFVKGEQYVYVLDINGTMLAHPVNENYVGKDFYRVQDSAGKPFIRDIVDTANAQGFGWIGYDWYDPTTRKERPKTVYFEKVDNLIFCSGVYSQNPASATAEETPADDTHLEAPAESAITASGTIPQELVEEEALETIPDDAKRLVEKAITFYQANGRGIALAEFSSPEGRFVKNGHYVYVLDFNGTMLAHPVNQEFVGKDFYRIKDADGKSFIKEIVDTANNGGSGWVEYKWYNPATKAEQPKIVYLKMIDNLIFCSGVYVD